MAMPFTVDAKTLTSVMLFLVSKVIFRCRVVAPIFFILLLYKRQRGTVAHDNSKTNFYC